MGFIIFAPFGMDKFACFRLLELRCIQEDLILIEGCMFFHLLLGILTSNILYFWLEGICHIAAKILQASHVCLSTRAPQMFRQIRSSFIKNVSIRNHFMSPYWRSLAEPWSMQAFRDYRTFLCFHKLYNSLAWAFQWLKYKIQLLHETVWWYIWFGTHQATFLNNQSIWILLFWGNSHILEWYFSFEPSCHWY